ncbi:hypothetical protein LCGC14_1124820 [marine sediment metagenome]|uniref:Phage tail collar domain-containing protein n=1 Tax=marine sediment metagenome TaxID=412755 RepID=A0A0F9Q8P7_9ZZZZ
MTIPSGLITIWNSTIATIPTGWVQCDGNNGTPDLRDKFVVGAGGSLAVDDTGGARTHTHDFTTDGHIHSIEPVPADTIPAGAGWDDDFDNQVLTGTTAPANHDPPFFSLVYIMFL